MKSDEKGYTMFGVSAIRLLQNSETQENMRAIMKGETRSKKNLRKVLSDHGLGTAERNLAKVLHKVNLELPEKTLPKKLTRDFF